MHAQGDVKRAAAWEAIYNEYCNQVVQDMFDVGLTHRNENLIVTLNALIVLPGVAGMGYILLAGESMPLLGIGMLLMMFFLLRLMGRIRTLTDKGEELALSASALREQGLTEETAHLLPHAAALSLTKDHPFCVRTEYLRTALRDAHNHNASLPR